MVADVHREQGWLELGTCDSLALDSRVLGLQIDSSVPSPTLTFRRTVSFNCSKTCHPCSPSSTSYN